MNNVDSDLEEGEILDDSPSSPCDSDKNVRELPRRYTIQKNRSKRIHKHRKRDCKNAIRYHAKKLAKLKKSPVKLRDITKKQHKSSCPYDKCCKISNKYDSVVKKHIVTDNGHSLSKQPLISEMKGSYSLDIQNLRLKPKNINDDKLLTRKDNFNNVNIHMIDDNSEDSKHYSQLSGQNSEDLLHFVKSYPNNKISNTPPSKSPNDKCEESEDEEELRKIALATFSKRKTDAELFQNLNKNEDCVELLEMNARISHPEIINLESDNYEVVDMEVDEDTEAAIEVFEKPLEGQLSEFIENLYVIDTKPFVEEDDNKDTLSEFQPIRNSSDEDFEADILRAELIESMCRKKLLLEEDDGSKQNQQPIVPNKSCINNNYQKPNNKFYHKHLKSKHPARKSLIKNPQKLPYNISKPVTHNNQLQIGKKSTERLIISLNDESSSEESDSQEESSAPEKNAVPENPVDSIVALISDCRQKSDSSEKNKALSCLSKAQQEEYQSLMKILAEKEKVPTPPETVQIKNDSANSKLNDLKLLEEKLLKFKENLQEKNESLALLSKEINSKKLLYMKSKLSSQLLKEQYLAAEKTRKTNLCVWVKSCNHFRDAKRTVSNLESKINQLQTLCFKIGASIQEKT